MTNLENLSSEEREAILARREYQKAWRAKNRDKIKRYNVKFYNKLSENMAKDDRAIKKPSE